MAESDRLPPPAAPWHALLAPLPADAVPTRRPVAPPEIAAKPEAAAIAGWEQLSVELGAGAAGLRHVLVVLDASGQVLSANDGVLYRLERSAGATTEVVWYHVSVGGRFEADGSFRGTHWHSTSVEDAHGEKLESAAVPSTPGDAEVASLRALIADVLRRAGAAESTTGTE